MAEARPAWANWALIGLVFVGGSLGTATRAALTLIIPPADGFPATIMGINVAGALLLGALLESLSRRGADEGPRRRIRLLLGAGFLGGFTTYSALATDSVLLAAGSPALALLNALGTLVLGALATWLGIVLAALVDRKRGHR
ncbi:CrcB protein [Marisediminicola sp. UYEF4]|uniref:fluoride efflux transporter FluC n=1 Tax=Marisediminicola sp. UYEF4 TaxID=1756384 RepID=UPI0033951469